MNMPSSTLVGTSRTPPSSANDLVPSTIASPNEGKDKVDAMDDLNRQHYQQQSHQQAILLDDTHSSHQSFTHSSSDIETASSMSAATSTTSSSSKRAITGISCSSPSFNTKPLVRYLLIFLLLGSILFVLFDSTLPDQQKIANRLDDFLDWLQDNPGSGSVAVTAIVAITTLILFPKSLLTLGTGIAFGSAFSLWRAVLLGSTAVALGSVLGSIAAFWLGRYLFRDRVRGWMVRKHPVWERALERALQQKGIRIMILLRSSPIKVPGMNYVFGVTPISLWSYSVALVAIVPETVAYCFVGATIGTSLPDMMTVMNGGDGDDSTVNPDSTNDATAVLQYVFLGLGIVACVGGILATSYYCKRELQKILAESEMEGVAADEQNDIDHAGVQEGQQLDEETGNVQTASETTAAAV